MKDKTRAVPKALQKCVCVHCLQKSSRLHHIRIEALGMGSLFFGEGTVVQLCEDCYRKSRPMWSMELCIQGGVTRYRKEDQMAHYLGSLPIAGRELVHNTLNFGPFARHFPSQDWIDYQLDRLPADKCRKLNLLTPDEIADIRKRLALSVPSHKTGQGKERSRTSIMRTA